MRTLNPEEYRTLPRPQLKWVVDGLIPRPGYLLMMGPPKAGKSFLAWDIAARVAQGKTVLGHQCSSGPQKVLYLQLDTKEAAWMERLSSMSEAGENLSIPNLRLPHPDDMPTPMLITTLLGQDAVHIALNATDPALVIVDVLREIHQEDENDSTAMKKVFDAMDPIFKGRAVIFVHHTRKLSAEDKVAPDPAVLARGSSYITGRVDGYWLLYGDAPNRKLYFESRFQPASTITAHQDAHTGRFSFPDFEQDSTLLVQLYALCAANLDKTHNQLWKLASEKHGVTRTDFYRLLRGAPCAHRAQTSAPLK